MKLPFSTAICFLTASAVLHTAGPALAGIEFEATTLKKDAGHSETTTAGTFKFKITGDKPVRITDVQTTCACVKAQTKEGKMEYKPGDTGEIETEFLLGTFEGVTTKQVIVHTDDEAHPETPLTVSINVPPLFSIEPNNVIWKVGDKPEPKSIRVKMLGTDPVRITSAKTTRPNIATEVKTVKDGWEYEIVVTPASTENPVLGVIAMETDCKFERYKKRLLFFNVTRTRPAAAQPPLPVPSSLGSGNGSGASGTSSDGTAVPASKP